MTDQTPSTRAGLRDEIADAIHRYDRDHCLSRNDIPSKHHRGEADAVLTLLYREWPWLRAEAEELDQARAELQQHAEAESADAAAGSYANSSEHAIAHPQPWLHVTFTSPDDTTANTSALAIRDHLRAEFDGVNMRITSNAVEPAAEQPARTTPDNPAASENAADNPAATEATEPATILDPAYLRQAYAEAIAADDGHPWDTLCADTQQHYRDNADAALAVRDRHVLQLRQRLALADEWTPPPPGSTAEQVPEHLLALIRDRLPDYTSTACQTADTVACAACYPGSGIARPQYDEIREHAERLHNRCRLNNKFTGQLCACGCHPEEQP